MHEVMPLEKHHGECAGNHKHTFILDLIIKLVNILILYALLQLEELTRQHFIG